MRGRFPAALFFLPRDAVNEYDYLPHSRACLPSSQRRSPKRPLISLLVPVAEIRAATSWFYIMSGRVEHTSGPVLSSFVRNWSLSMRLLSAALIFGPRRGHPLSPSFFLSSLFLSHLCCCFSSLFADNAREDRSRISIFLTCRDLTL